MLVRKKSKSAVRRRAIILQSQTMKTEKKIQNMRNKIALQKQVVSMQKRVVRKLKKRVEQKEVVGLSELEKRKLELLSDVGLPTQDIASVQREKTKSNIVFWVYVVLGMLVLASTIYTLILVFGDHGLTADQVAKRDAAARYQAQAQVTQANMQQQGVEQGNAQTAQGAMNDAVGNMANMVNFSLWVIPIALAITFFLKFAMRLGRD